MRNFSLLTSSLQPRASSPPTGWRATVIGPRAASWLLLGETAGRGKWGGKPGAAPVKLVYVYPLLRSYLSILRGIPRELPEAPTT
ncbi:MAG: hypothetical protein HYV63_00240 [Candidatus Schekmanbacteria bacterium]|nr:hypothetical protein [Candidatus Schekmanbacteria bacterium]